MMTDSPHPQQASWDELIQAAKSVQGGWTVSPLIEAGEVAAAIMTDQGNLYVGVCIDTACSLGMCAERNAVASMLTHHEKRISKLVAIMPDGSFGAPCGACRELLMQLDKANQNMEILMSYPSIRTITLKELLPEWWQ